jgi:signal transduction histidine kinase
MLNSSREQLIGRHHASLTHPGDRAENAAGILQLMRGDLTSYDNEMRLLRRGGGVVWVLLTVTLLRDASGTPKRMTSVVMDISERKRAEQALLEREEELRIARDELERRVDERTAELASAVEALHREIRERGLAERQVRQLLGRHVHAIEQERGRISRELHDTLGQHLAALAIGLKMIGDQPGEPDGLREPVARLRQVVERLDNEIDRLSYELRPPALDELGLEEALRSYAISWGNDGGVAVEVHTHGLHTGRLPAAVETTAYRVAQEALTNVRKHAGARRVGVILERRLDELRLVVEDDGCGFEPAVTGPKAGRRWGLRSMAERAALVAGNLEIESSPGAGTTVYMVIPVRPGAEETWQGNGVDAGSDENG